MKKSSLPTCLLCLLGLLILLGCQPRIEKDSRRIPEVLEGEELGASLKKREAGKRSWQWWRLFKDPLLTQYIETALEDNFTLKQGFARLEQAAFLAQQVAGDQYPTLDAKMQAGTKLTLSDESAVDFSENLGLSLSWQADLWGGHAAARQAALLDAQAEEEALVELSLALSLEIAQTYYELIEQSLLQKLVARQIATNTQAQDLLLLGFANGTATSADVLQQKELLSSVKTQQPVLKARRAVLNNRLQVLLGHIPENKELSLSPGLPDLPPFPSLGISADLLLNRPDLRRLQHEVASADYRVAQVTSERLPDIKLGGTMGLNSSELLLSLFTEVLATVLDWDQNKHKLARQQAKVRERMAAWSQAYLEVVAEVENNLAQEREQENIMQALEEQQQVAEALLEEVRRRYLHGQSDYLPVLSAFASLQKLERDRIRQQRILLSYRLQLYHALGGCSSQPLSSSL